MNQSSKTPRALLALSGTLVFLAIVLIWSLVSLGPSTPGEEVGFDQLQRTAASGQVKEAVLYEEDSRVVLDLNDGQKIWSAYPDNGSTSAQLIGQLAGTGAKVTVEQQWGRKTLALFSQFILPLLILANLFGIFILLSRGGSGQVKELFSFSRIGAKRAQGQETNPYRFRDVAAAEFAIEELQEIADYLRSPQRFAAMGALPPKGVLLYGPPGCGKTLLARSLAGEVGVPFYFISGSEFVESLVGVGAARVRDLFQQAAATAPALIFIDELDAAGRRRGAGVGGGNDEREQTLNEMLVQMDGFAPSLGVVVIAATNRPDILDPALLRPGRFDRHIGLELPDLDGRMDILKLHAAGRKFDSAVKLELISKATPGMSGADLANVVNEAALLAVRRGANSISQDDLNEGVERVLSGPRKRGRILTPEEIKRLAYHEAGHAVVAANVDYPAEVKRVSIVARGRDVAHTSVHPRSDRAIITRSELLAEMSIAMGGVAAETLITGEASTTIEDDLDKATDLARRFAGRYGMSEKVGRLRVLHADAEVFLGKELAASSHSSESTLQSVDSAVKDLVMKAEAHALQVLQRKRAVLDRIAKALEDQESLDEDELAALLGVRAPAKRRASKRPARAAASS